MKKFLPIIVALFLSLPVIVWAQSPWPGQSGNPVGFAAAPGWPGSFNTTPCPASPASGSSWATATLITLCTYSTSTHTTTSCAYCIFEYVDFLSSSTVDNDVLATGSNELFIGDRFQSNYLSGAAVSVVASGSGSQYFFYNSIVPLVSIVSTPPAAAWPSATAGQNPTWIPAPGNGSPQISGINVIPQADGYGFGFEVNSSGGPFYADHNEIWGFANAIVLLTTTQPVSLTSNWIHDSRYSNCPGAQCDHTDGIGYLNGAVGPSNVSIIGNVSALLGNTDDLAWQGSTGNYNNLITNENFFSGDGTTILFCGTGLGSLACTNSTFYGNTFGSDIVSGGPTYGPQFGLGSGTQWACNVISYRTGSAWIDQNDSWGPTSAMNGQYFVIPTGTLPNISYNGTTDTSYGLSTNNFCARTSPASYNFGKQAIGSSSAGQTIVLSNSNTGTLSISSVALQVGTHFSITSNTCGATLAPSATCAVTVKFSPTGVGPQTDNLEITDNTPGVTSPQIVPLMGLATASGSGPSPLLLPILTRVSGL